MKITDPSFWPPDLGSISFEQGEGRLAGREFSIRAVDGRELAALAPISDGDCDLLVDHGEAVSIGGRGCWELSLLDRQGGLIDQRTFFPAQRGKAGDRELTPEVTAWATLTLLWSLTATSPPRG